MPMDYTAEVSLQFTTQEVDAQSFIATEVWA
jgi:hypothetical protein